MSYTPEQIEQAIDEAFGTISAFDCVAVDELPQEGKKGTIYNTHIWYRREWIDGKGFEEFIVYDQYVWANGEWVWLGTVDTYCRRLNGLKELKCRCLIAQAAARHSLMKAERRILIPPSSPQQMAMFCGLK